MKKLIFLSTIVLFLFNTCKKDNDFKNGEMHLIATITGGCHGQDFSGLKNDFVVIDDIDDAVEFEVSGDTLNLFVGINYICCAPFETETVINDDTLVITITDTCPFPYQECYCRCMCYYTWNFQFTGFAQKEYAFIIKLIDPREEEIKIFDQGTIDLSR
jgi:hypothetical protein